MQEKAIDYTRLKHKEFEKQYFKEFKRFFKDKDDLMQSLMSFGVACHKGWYNLIWDLTQAMDNYMENKSAPQDTQIVQVKEKFGGLRFYIHGGDETIYGMIRFAEEQAYKICEKCGERGSIDTRYAWILTLCDKCKKERTKEMKEKEKRVKLKLAKL